mmetsp:Transcript_4172/g.7324  ORF Transcript_4172/g.7324 Transcript_4172/m.7324 type:complete len:258 (-) Transcript_4172:437-1210(-)
MSSVNQRSSGIPSLSSSLPAQNQIHLARRVLHFATGLLFAFCKHHFTLYPLIFTSFLVFASLFVFIMECLRLNNPQFNKLIHTVFKPVMRKNESHGFTGMAYYISGIALSCACFTAHAAIFGIILLAIIDPIAAVSGVVTRQNQVWAQLKNGKSVIGFVCGILAGTIALLRIVMVAEFGEEKVDSVDILNGCFCIAFCGALIEVMIPSPRLTLASKTFPFALDDNLFIPLITSCVAQVVLTQFPSFSSMKLAQFLFA